MPVNDGKLNLGWKSSLMVMVAVLDYDGVVEIRMVFGMGSQTEKYKKFKKKILFSSDHLCR
jgi:hypothetical protein